ncbi:MAG TPA: ORF6N domain-containing protein [Phycisphaerae bacterium]|jgi:hypothetical protein
MVHNTFSGQLRLPIFRLARGFNLAALYGVSPKALNQAVSRNHERFPDDFMFQLSPDEFRNLKSQFVTSSWGGARRARPYAFTEQGVAMLSAVLRSPTAVRVSIEIVRAFVRLRQLLASHEDLRQKLDELGRKLEDHDGQILSILDAIREIMEPPADDSPPHPFGFHPQPRPRQSHATLPLKSKI